MLRVTSSRSIMNDFARDTGLSDASRKPRRYLWTDAYAVCNFLGLYRESGDPAFLELALKLVDQVHRVLGRHRDDDARSGWLSGLDDEQARRHPTLGGLRIGKRLNERAPGEKAQGPLEWEQDGQYFHYLSKWMHALDCVGRVSGHAVYNRWAVELARVAHAAFTYTPPLALTKRMYWKMSIDLHRPLVASMGQHDALDGLITYQQLLAAAKRFPEAASEPGLGKEIEDMRAMCSGQNWATEDALGIGGLLGDAYRLVQLVDRHGLHETSRLEALLADIEHSLQSFMAHNSLDAPAEYRLAFRELGLSIGLQAITRMQREIEASPGHFDNARNLVDLLSSLSRFLRIREAVEAFWLEPPHQASRNWREHGDINSVMLATSLVPDGYLQITA